MIEGNQNVDTTDNELSLKEIIVTGQEYLQELLHNWKLIILISIPLIFYMGYKAMTTDPTYSAELTFMVNEDDGGGLGAVGGLLGQFGLGGGGGGGKYNIDKMLELSRSRKIMEQVLFEKREVEGKMDYLANHMLRIYELREKWAKDNPDLADFSFRHSEVETFDMSERRIMKILYRMIVGNESPGGLLTTSYGKKSGIINMACVTESEDFSILITDITFEKLSDFYVLKTIEKQKKTHELIEAKVDSVENLLHTKEYALASFKDTHHGLWTSKNNLKEKQLMRDVEILNILYGETLRNLEIADFSLKSKTPFVQLIDTPISPLKKNKQSLLFDLIVGGILGGILGACIVIARKLYKDVLNETT
jgi:hypothetical protein